VRLRSGLRQYGVLSDTSPTQPLSPIALCATRERTGLLSAAPPPQQATAGFHPTKPTSGFAGTQACRGPQRWTRAGDGDSLAPGCIFEDHARSRKQNLPRSRPEPRFQTSMKMVVMSLRPAAPLQPTAVRNWSDTQLSRHLPFSSLALASGPYRAIFDRAWRRWTLPRVRPSSLPVAIFEKTTRRNTKSDYLSRKFEIR